MATETTQLVEFRSFPKLARLRRDVTITEKVDGTNAAVGVTEDGQVYAQSRKRIITLEDDNYGFARWVHEHEEELKELGPGIHFGEWYGLGIQRNYGLKEKHFALFNTNSWTDERPACCDVVPILEQYTFCDEVVENALNKLRLVGSVIAPGFMNPEGVVIYHHAAGHYYKVTLDNDSSPKSLKQSTSSSDEWPDDPTDADWVHIAPRV